MSVSDLRWIPQFEFAPSRPGEQPGQDVNQIQSRLQVGVGSETVNPKPLSPKPLNP